MTLDSVNDKESKTFPRVIFKNPSRKGFLYWVLSSLLTMSRQHLLDLIDFSTNEKPLTVDIGCSIGYVTRPLSLWTNTIGLDLDKERIRHANKLNPLADFICCDLCNLPLRNASIDMVVCASVLEHIDNLPKALGEIKFILRKKGKLLAGYPVETRLLEIIIKSFWISESATWSQFKLTKNEEQLKDPHIHKQNFLEIRKLLEKNFVLLKRRKTPNNWSPDLFSIYESSLLLKN